MKSPGRLRRLLGYEFQVVRERPNLARAAFCALAAAGVFQWYEWTAPPPAKDWNVSALAAISKMENLPVTFAVLGDAKNDDEHLSALLNDIAGDPEIAFILTLGDMVAKGSAVHYADFFRVIGDHVRLPLLLCAGNHELTLGGRANFQSIAGLSYYSFQVGDAGFLVLDDVSFHGGVDEAQLRWLSKELGRFQHLKYRIVALHTPPWDPRGPEFDHGLHADEARQLMNILREGKATQVFASHVHGFFRGNWEGIPYWVTGGAGARLAGDDPEHYFFHYLKVRIDGNGVQVEVVQPPVDKGTGIYRLEYEAERFLRNWLRFKRVELALIVALAALTAMHILPLFSRRVRVHVPAPRRPNPKSP